MAAIDFQVKESLEATAARVGLLKTRRGTIETPVFMPVGTQASVRSVRFDDVRQAGAKIVLANTYHLSLRPGKDVFEAFGDIHRFMNWDGAVLTDSGGFQVFSLAPRINEDGASFKSHLDGRQIFMSPESSLAMQHAIGSDIMMVFDHCVASTVDFDVARDAMERTHRWALRSLQARQNPDQALFGIVQGACFESLRRESAAFLCDQPFDGFAIGGLAVGETKSEREDFTALSASLLPKEKPRYLMGVGKPIDLLEACHRGVDMFDCILPTALAGYGLAYTWEGRLRLSRKAYRLSQDPIAASCLCYTCRHFSRGYLHHLLRADEVLGWNLLSTHNLYFYQEFMRELRRNLSVGTFLPFYQEKRAIIDVLDAENPAPKQVSKRRSPSLSRGAFQVVLNESQNAVIQHRDSQEIMHRSSDPNLEAKELYIDSLGVSELLSLEIDRELVVWDVGLGAGHNAMALLQVALGKPRPVKLVSFENDLDALALSLQHQNKFPHLRHGAPVNLLRHGRWRSKDHRFDWELIHADFTTTFDQAPNPDVIFFDPFSSETNPTFWRFEFLQKLADFLKQKPCILATYSRSTRVRASLLAVGFQVAMSERGTLASLGQALSQALDQKWLERWERSSAKAPEGLSLADHHLFLKKVREHPQFQAT